jgi:hypothetical protein
VRLLRSALEIKRVQRVFFARNMPVSDTLKKSFSSRFFHSRTAETAPCATTRVDKKNTTLTTYTRRARRVSTTAVYFDSADIVRRAGSRVGTPSAGRSS